jgi:hypothetical protein
MKKIYLLLIVSLWSISSVHAQAINKSKNELKKANPRVSVSSGRSTNNASSFNDSDDIGLFLQVFGYVTFGVIKYGLVGDYRTENQLHYNLNAHPFSIHGRGNYSRTDSLKTKNFRLDIENQYLSGGNSFYGNQLDVSIRPSKHFYFKTNYFELFENDLFTQQTDRISLFYFNLAYDRIRLPNFNLGWTFGASYVGNEVKKAGFSYGVNASYFLQQNMSVSLDSKWSTINLNPVNSMELKGKYFRKNFFGSLSYNRLKIATPVYHLIGVGGGIYF